MGERRNQVDVDSKPGIPTEAQQLSRSAEHFDRIGMSATARLFRNAAMFAALDIGEVTQ